ncbi:sulfotransferase 6B1-like [Protobothrops mucrosquamatus]|uniref:sulfotransferase 6B1-like n=1 Tax=Protobothrops mucrosquamatus TaxID=103944 RepID=UPI0010FB829D|nr:sulfotransferase 6B1-like [Protobothrops mucrosquamatus]
MDPKSFSKFLDEKVEGNEKAAPSEQMFMYDGVLYPAMITCVETLKRVHTFRAWQDDIILVSYPKTGKHYSFRMEKMPSRRIIKTHLIPQKLPKSIFEKKAKRKTNVQLPFETTIAFETTMTWMTEKLHRGIVGDWTSVFSESQSERMDRKFEESVAKTKLGMMLKYEQYCKN